MSTKRIFVIHAIKDKKLADMLVDLLTACGAVTPSEIFCTPLEASRGACWKIFD